MTSLHLRIRFITGELITELISSEYYNQGVYSITFDASNLASGTYLYSLNNGHNVITKTMTLIK